MPRYRVKLSQYVQEVGYLQVEAANEADARLEALRLEDLVGVDWMDGSNSDEAEVLEVEEISDAA